MLLKRRQALAAISGGLAMPYVRPSWAQAGTVNIYNWSEYIGETTLADFETETGIGVVYDLYASAEEMQAKMLAGSTGYDVVIMSSLKLPNFVKAGVFDKLDRAKLTNWGNLDPGIMKIVEGFDPGNLYAIPYMWGSVGFVFNMDMVKERLPDADLADLGTIFNPENAAKLADCGISILDSPTDIGFVVLAWLGLDASAARAPEYDQMVAAFAKIRPYITTFDNSNYLSAMPNGEICVANTWSGDYSVALRRAEEAGIKINLQYFVPKTGSPAWFDNWCIPSDAASKDNAHAFINYMLRPEVIAAATNFTGYANANLAANPLVDPAIFANPAVYPDAETMSRLFTPAPQSEEQDSEITRAWATIKAG